MSFCTSILVRMALVALPIVLAAGAAHGQPRTRLIAVLIHGTERADHERLTALRDGMRELGYVEGRSYQLEARFSEGRFERLPDLARELLRLNPDVAVGAPVVSAQAFWRETKTVPIVMATGSGALQIGMIASLARPGGNVTGVTHQADDLTRKLFELLAEIAPRVKRVMVLSSGRALVEADTRRGSRAAAAALGMALIEAWADSPNDIRQLSDRCQRERCEALVVLIDPNLFTHRREVVSLAAKLRLPAIYPTLEYVHDHGLIAYAADQRENIRRAAHFVDRILKGARPADLPVEQPTKFELVINLNTARALGLTMPPSVLARADQVIE
jgi:putative tryptophan/tyrosine transport system substrate-binding protein